MSLITWLRLSSMVPFHFCEFQVYLTQKYSIIVQTSLNKPSSLFLAITGAESQGTLWWPKISIVLWQPLPAPFNYYLTMT